MITGVSNQGSLTAQVNLHKNHNDLQQALQRLSTGKKINSGKDDPAGLIVALQLAAEITAARAEEQVLRRADASANISDAPMSELSGMTDEMRRLQLQAANSGAFSDDEIAANQMQIDLLASSYQRFGNQAIESLDRYTMPDDGNAGVAAQIRESMVQVNSLTSGQANSLTSGNSTAAETALDTATTAVTTARGTIGAYQKNHVQPQISALQTKQESLQASRSIIEDADFAVEASNLVRSQILTQANVQALKIANHQSENVLFLLS